MYKICKSKQSAQRQKFIAECMVQLWKKQNYNQITVSEICKQAGVPRKTFYRYFENKEDVFSLICDDLMMQYETYLGPYGCGEKYTMEKDIEKFFMFNKRHEALWNLVQRDNMSAMVIEWVVLKIVEKGQKRSEDESMPDSAVRQMRISFFMHGLFAIFFGWKKRGYTISEKEAAEIAVKLVSVPLYEW